MAKTTAWVDGIGVSWVFLHICIVGVRIDWERNGRRVHTGSTGVNSGRLFLSASASRGGCDAAVRLCVHGMYRLGVDSAKTHHSLPSRGPNSMHVMVV